MTITGIDVAVQREPPLIGTVLSRPCGDPDLYRLVDVDLDAEPLAVGGRDLTPQLVESLGAWRTDPVRFPYEVTRQDAETFAIVARTDNCFCSWTASLRWSSAGRTGTVIVNDAGSPFRVTADAGASRCTVLTNSVACR